MMHVVNKAKSHRQSPNSQTQRAHASTDAGVAKNAVNATNKSATPDQWGFMSLISDRLLSYFSLIPIYTLAHACVQK